MTDPYDSIKLSDILGETTTCARCGVLCRVPNEKPDEKARIIKNATHEAVAAGTAMCATCVITGWLKDGPFAQLVTPEKIRWPAFQTQMGAVFRASGKEDADVAEINWEAMIANWDLPFPKTKRKQK